MTEQLAPPKITISAEKCIGCGACVQSCPADVIRMDRSLQKAIVVYGADCQVCYLCEDDCPSGAITIDHNISNSRRYSIYDLLAIDVWSIDGGSIANDQSSNIKSADEGTTTGPGRTG